MWHMHRISGVIYYSSQLDDLRNQGIFKEERAILSKQNSEIEVEFPIGSAIKKKLTCALIITWAYHHTPM